MSLTEIYVVLLLQKIYLSHVERGVFAMGVRSLWMPQLTEMMNNLKYNGEANTIDSYNEIKSLIYKKFFIQL